MIRFGCSVGLRFRANGECEDLTFENRPGGGGGFQLHWR